MKDFVDRENEIFATLRAFDEADLDFVVVGGYGVSAYRHRFSVDADIVVPENQRERFAELLTDRGYEEVEDRELGPYGGRYQAFEKDRELPVTIDLLVGGLVCRQTEARWGYEYLAEHATQREIRGSEERVQVTVANPEILVAVKLHSGRLTDARDAVALSDDVEWSRLQDHLDRGDSNAREEQLGGVLEAIADPDFEDAFKGVFATSTAPDQQIAELHDFLTSNVGTD